MVAELVVDPYTLVSRSLRYGQATRAELKTSTGLDYTQIAAALERFEMMGQLVKRTDGSGIEHFAWDGEEYAPESPKPIEQKPPEAAAVPVVSSEADVEPDKDRPKGWSLMAVVRSFISDCSYDAEITVQRIYSQLRLVFPKACGTYTAAELKAQISGALNVVRKQDLIELVGREPGGGPNTYRRKRAVVEKPEKDDPAAAPEQQRPPVVTPVGDEIDKATRLLVAELRADRDAIDRVIAFLEKRSR